MKWLSYDEWVAMKDFYAKRREELKHSLHYNSMKIYQIDSNTRIKYNKDWTGINDFRLQRRVPFLWFNIWESTANIYEMTVVSLNLDLEQTIEALFRIEEYNKTNRNILF